MKKLATFILVALVTICANAQSDIVGGTHKVKKEKTLRCGIEAYVGGSWYSIDGYKAKNGKGGSDIEANFVITGPLKPSNPEGRWYGEASIGFEYHDGKVESEKQSYSNSNEEDISFYELFNIGVKAKYLLNPLTTHGKWFISARLTVCPLVGGLPTLKDSSVSNGRYSYIGTSSLGLGTGAGLSVSYEWKHFGIGIEGSGKIVSTYSDSGGKNAINALYGFKWNIKYIF